MCVYMCVHTYLCIWVMVCNYMNPSVRLSVRPPIYPHTCGTLIFISVSLKLSTITSERFTTCHASPKCHDRNSATSFQHLSTTIGRFELHDQACLPAACGNFRGTCSLATEDPTSAGASALELRVKRNAKSPTESWWGDMRVTKAIHAIRTFLHNHQAANTFSIVLAACLCWFGWQGLASNDQKVRWLWKIATHCKNANNSGDKSHHWRLCLYGPMAFAHCFPRCSFPRCRSFELGAPFNTTRLVLRVVGGSECFTIAKISQVPCCTQYIYNHRFHRG